MNAVLSRKRVLWGAFAGILAAALMAAGIPSLTAKGADHLDAPGLTSPGGDGRLDLNDVYAFQSPHHPDNTVLIMTVNPFAGVLSPTEFHPHAQYQLLIDNDDDAMPDVGLIVDFPGAAHGEQRVRLSRRDGMRHERRGEQRWHPDREWRQQEEWGEQRHRDNGRVIAEGVVGEDIPVHGGGWLRAGNFDDLFFFDLGDFLAADFCATGVDAFAGANVSGIVLEIPSWWLTGDSSEIGVWARTVLYEVQVDRMGRPAINTVFVPNNPFEPAPIPSQKDAFNAGLPKNDQQDFRGEIVNTLEIFYGAGDPTVDALADFLLPDILTVDTASAAGFLNGRQLSDDVIDAELDLVTNGAVTTDCVDANDLAFPGVFPYLAPAH